MEKKMILKLKKHKVFYVKSDLVNFYITVPNKDITTNICIELKSKMNNYNLELNDEVWVMENVKNTFSYIDDYNITLVLPVLKEEEISILEKLDSEKYSSLDKILGSLINNSYLTLKENEVKIASQVLLVNNDRYKTFISWFTTKYKERVICKNLLELIQLFNANATSYKKIETKGVSFVVGSYNTEVDAPMKEEIAEPVIAKQMKKPALAGSSGIASYWLLAFITIVVAGIVAVLAFTMK